MRALLVLLLCTVALACGDAKTSTTHRALDPADGGVSATPEPFACPVGTVALFEGEVLVAPPGPDCDPNEESCLPSHTMLPLIEEPAGHVGLFVAPVAVADLDPQPNVTFPGKWLTPFFTVAFHLLEGPLQGWFAEIGCSGEPAWCPTTAQEIAICEVVP